MKPVPNQQAIAVFGSSEPAPGSEEYRLAHEVGRLLAHAGFAVVNGGYGGVMEASARGAREAGGSTIGVTTGVFRQERRANPYIDRELREKDLFDRTRRLVDTAAGYLILPGKSGTLAELAFLLALRRADLLGSRPIVLVGEVWRGLIDLLRRDGLAGEPEVASCRLVRTPAEAVDIVTLCLRGPQTL